MSFNLWNFIAVFVDNCWDTIFVQKILQNLILVTNHKFVRFLNFFIFLFVQLSGITLNSSHVCVKTAASFEKNVFFCSKHYVHECCFVAENLRLVTNCWSANKPPGSIWIQSASDNLLWNQNNWSFPRFTTPESNSAVCHSTTWSCRNCLWSFCLSKWKSSGTGARIGRITTQRSTEVEICTPDHGHWKLWHRSYRTLSTKNDGYNCTIWKKRN